MKKRIISVILGLTLAVGMLAGCSLLEEDRPSGPINAISKENEEAGAGSEASKENEEAGAGSEALKENEEAGSGNEASKENEEAGTGNEESKENEEAGSGNEASKEDEAAGPVNEVTTEIIENRPNATLQTGDIKILEPGDPAPDFTVSLTNGDLFSLSDHDDKVVLINFWATWCGPCVGEMPGFEQLWNDGTEDFEMICVNCQEDRKTVDRFVSRQGFTFKIAYDEDGTVGSYYPTDYIPYTLIVKNGYVLQTYIGSPKDSYSEYREIVDEALND